jgi:hypothetical protein
MSETTSNLYHVQINEEIERCIMLSSSERRKFERIIVDTEYYKEIYLNIWKKISDEAQKFNGVIEIDQKTYFQVWKAQKKRGLVNY